MLIDWETESIKAVAAAVAALVAVSSKPQPLSVPTASRVTA